LLQIEAELTSMETKCPELAGEITSIKKLLMEKHANEYSMSLGNAVLKSSK
jgi:ribosomal protein L32E